MTTSDSRRAAPPAPAARQVAEPSSVPSICPYLRAPAGWRSATPSREHRCTAVMPSARLSGDKQGRLCLVAAHGDCPTFVAAREARAARGVAPLVDRRPLARTIPTVTEPARPRLGFGLGANGRRIGQGGVALLMIVALVAVVLARTAPSGTGPGSTLEPSEPAGSIAIATSTPSDAPATIATSASPSVTVPPTMKPSPTPRATAPPRNPSPTSVPTARSTPAPTAVPTSAPSGSYVTYKVKSGDTLSAIAARYKTSVQAIADANGIKATAYLQIGQVLRIPR